MKAVSIVERVIEQFRENDLLTGRRRLLVAVSGGQDSVCLLHVLAELQSELKVKLHVAHLDHRLRGAESAADAAYVVRLAKKLGIPATVGKRDVKAYRRRHRLTLEEAAREVRYTFLAETARAVGTDRVAVAHTADDNVETILMHLIRGSGTRGLLGLQPVNVWRAGDDSVTVVRPLLGVSREETAAYCRRHRLRPRVDTTNLSLSSFRNRVRLKLVPLLRQYNPRIGEALQRTSRLAGEAMAFLDGESAARWDKIVREQPGAVFLDRRKFSKVPAVLQRHLLRVAMEKLLGNVQGIESRHLEKITAALSLPAGKKLSLPAGLVFTVDYDHYALSRDATGLSSLPPLEGETGLKIPGETRLAGWTVTASVQSVIPAKAGIQKSNPFTAYLDFDKTGKDLSVRALAAGDSFQPLGMGRPKKVARFMIDARIPRSWRPGVPIVASRTQIVWVAGWRIDERVKVTPATKKVLRLAFKRIE